MAEPRRETNPKGEGSRDRNLKEERLARIVTKMGIFEDFVQKGRRTMIKIKLIQPIFQMVFTRLMCLLLQQIVLMLIGSWTQDVPSI